MNYNQEKSLKYTRSRSTLFHTPVRGQDIEEGYLTLLTTGDLTIKRGFQLDGPTFLPDASWIIEPAAEHDAFYWLIRNDYLPECFKDQVDDHFYLRIMEYGVPRWRAKLYRIALRKFGHRALRR